MLEKICFNEIYSCASYCQSRPYANKRISLTELKICFMRLEIKTVWSCLPHHSYQHLPINGQIKLRNIAWTTKYQVGFNLNPLLKSLFYLSIITYQIACKPSRVLMEQNLKRSKFRGELLLDPGVYEDWLVDCYTLLLPNLT